jgi:hypothetical protein
VTRQRTIAVLAGLLVIGLVPVAKAAVGPAPDPRVGAARDSEPVVLQGSSFAEWAAPAEVTAKAPSVAGAECLDSDNSCTHNQYETPEVASGSALGEGTPIDKLLGYRWTGRRFEQIPFQVDELATRYLSNNASTFSAYSQVDQHTTYVFDEERFRWTKSDPADPCRAMPDGPPTTPDPVPGLDHNDEISFMASDAAPAAPAGAPLPEGIVSAKQVVVTDPSNGGAQRVVYVMVASDQPNAPKPKYDASNGYVRYQPDADSDTFLFSESSYESYGNTFKGPWFDPVTNTCITDQPKQHRPKDTAWIRTSRYAYRYEGRWLMTELQVAPKRAKRPLDERNWRYGPDLIDQWKARAFQQRPGGETPCCGYEEEVNNWGGSGILMGWRAGPVRVIRATWGADSSTNNVRTELFYRDEVRQVNNLRVHVIPPADGIYAQWDYNAGKITKYYNPWVPEGVDVDGRNDEVFGNTFVHAASDGVRFQDGDPIPLIGPQDLSLGTPGERCPESEIDEACVHNDIDVADPTFGGVNPGLNYEQVTGPYGTLVHRLSVKQVTGGTAYSLATIPYYRDDACFDDGTGTDPGPHVKPRAVDPAVDSAGQPRECWTPERGDPAATQPRDHFYQGDIGTHGIHIQFIADSDNALTTLPLTEIASEERIVVIPGLQPNLGERYGRGTEKPLVAVVLPLP